MTMIGPEMDAAPEEWPRSIRDDFIHLFCGERIGGGVSRTVHVDLANTSYVFKIELTARTFQNIIEWTTWEEVGETRWAKWFAPCRWISPNGHILVQRRTNPIAKPPKRLPDFFTDLKLSNFGEIDGQVVCHDYGFNQLVSDGLSNARMATAEFRL